MSDSGNWSGMIPMSDALDLEKLEWEWEREGPQRTTSRTSFPLLVEEVRRLRALLTAPPDESGFEIARQATIDFYDHQLATTGNGGGVQTALLKFIGERFDAVRALKIEGDTDE